MSFNISHSSSFTKITGDQTLLVTSTRLRFMPLQRCGNRSSLSSPLQQDSEFLLQDEKFNVVKGSISVLPTQISKMGLYLVVTVTQGVVVMWDQKTSLFIKISPKYQVNMCCYGVAHFDNMMELLLLLLLTVLITTTSSRAGASVWTVWKQ